MIRRKKNKEREKMRREEAISKRKEGESRIKRKYSHDKKEEQEKKKHNEEDSKPRSCFAVQVSRLELAWKSSRKKKFFASFKLSVRKMIMIIIKIREREREILIDRRRQTEPGRKKDIQIKTKAFQTKEKL